MNAQFIKLARLPIRRPSIHVTHRSHFGLILSPASGPLLEKPNVMAKISTSRVDKLLSSMGYGSRKEMARVAKAGGITLDGAALCDVTTRIPVTPDLPNSANTNGWSTPSQVSVGRRQSWPNEANIEGTCLMRSATKTPVQMSTMPPPQRW